MYLLEKKLKHNVSDFHERINKNKEMTKVHLKLPKFKLESEISLVEPLKKLGLEKMFGKKAQLTGISEKPLKVNDVIQKIFIEVDEVGSKDATAVQNEDNPELFEKGKPLYFDYFGRVISLKRTHRPVPFVADHPFIFFVRRLDTQLDTGVLLFQGRVVEPTEYPE